MAVVPDNPLVPRAVQGRGKRKEGREGAVAVVPDNPLVPHRVLLQIFRGMVESRLLEERVRGRGAVKEVRGQEACRAAVLAGLTEGDLSSDVAGSVTSASLRGVPLAGLIAGKGEGLPCVLPAVEEVRGRFYLALGAAAALKASGSGRVLVLFAEGGKRSVWQDALRLAAEGTLPVLFVALPGVGAAVGDLAARATTLGVPGIAVESTDAVALYRVAGECLGRARAGGGPALMHCIPFAPLGQPPRKAPDPQKLFAQQLVERGLMERDEPERLREAFRERLRAVGLRKKPKTG